MATNKPSTKSKTIKADRLEQLLAIERAAKQIIDCGTGLGWCKTCNGSIHRHAWGCVVGKLQDALGEGKNDG